jgi:SAM-dependent methyltransferase
MPAVANMLGSEALDFLLRDFEFTSVVDVGCGAGRHARCFADAGKDVTTISFERYGDFAPTFVGDFADFRAEQPFDLVWCSHTLEHQRNVGQFLERLIALAKPGGLIAITVPPARHRIVGGHVTMWNAGLLLYNLVLAGLDCRHAKVLTYGYNISVIVRRRLADLPPLRHDAGDIERLARFFPLPMKQKSEGRIERVRWEKERARISPAGEALDAGNLDIAAFRRLTPFSSDAAALDWAARSVGIPGHVLEFGVHTGRSIRVLAAARPARVVHGFDSFEGLPSDWERAPGSTYRAGHFRVAKLPEVPPTVRLWKGWFHETLPPWLAAHDGDVSFVHVDCDLYESTRTVLEALDGRLRPGSIVVFDELCDWRDRGVYPNWEAGEWRALREWLRHGRVVRPLCRGPDYSAAVSIVR